MSAPTVERPSPEPDAAQRPAPGAIRGASLVVPLAILALIGPVLVDAQACDEGLGCLAYGAVALVIGVLACPPALLVLPLVPHLGASPVSPLATLIVLAVPLGLAFWAWVGGWIARRLGERCTWRTWSTRYALAAAVPVTGAVALALFITLVD